MNSLKSLESSLNPNRLLGVEVVSLRPDGADVAIACDRIVSLVAAI